MQDLSTLNIATIEVILDGTGDNENENLYGNQLKEHLENAFNVGVTIKHRKVIKKNYNIRMHYKNHANCGEFGFDDDNPIRIEEEIDREIGSFDEMWRQ